MERLVGVACLTAALGCRREEVLARAEREAWPAVTRGHRRCFLEAGLPTEVWAAAAVVVSTCRASERLVEQAGTLALALDSFRVSLRDASHELRARVLALLDERPDMRWVAAQLRREAGE